MEKTKTDFDTWYKEVFAPSGRKSEFTLSDAFKPYQLGLENGKQLGRSEVIEEIEKTVEDCFGDSHYYKLLKYEFTSKLNQLKENK